MSVNSGMGCVCVRGSGYAREWVRKKKEKFSNSNLMESLGKTSRKISSLLKMSPF